MSYNPVLELDCTNLINAKPSWGTTLCVTPPGGNLTTRISNGTTTSRWNTSSEYSDATVSLPANGSLANGTTTQCGEFYQAGIKDTCTTICLEHHITANLFVAINPSLSLATCDTDLQRGAYYCVHPVLAWNFTASYSLPPLTYRSTSTASLTSSATSTLASTPASTTGTISTLVDSTTIVTTAISLTPTTSLSSSTTSAVATQPSLGVKQTIGSYNFQGCYTEISNGRALSGASYVYDTMTLESCAANCTDFRYFGVEYGRE